MRLTARQQLALELLASGEKVSNAAEACNCSRQAIYKYLDNPGFRAELTRRQSEYLQALTGQLLNLRDDFIAAIKAGLTDRAINTRLRAASIYGAKFQTFIELGILEQRISALERGASSRGKR